MTAYTSATAHREHVLDGKATSQRQRILNLLREYDEPMSRSTICACFTRVARDGGPPIPLASICGRVKTLLESGLVRVAREDHDPITGHLVQYLEAVRPEPKQRTFEAFSRRGGALRGGRA